MLIADQCVAAGVVVDGKLQTKSDVTDDLSGYTSYTDIYRWVDGHVTSRRSNKRPPIESTLVLKAEPLLKLPRSRDVNPL